MLLSDIGTSFILGLLTPLTAVCVLPLYPGFISYLANKLAGEQKTKYTPIKLGLTVTAGVILFMLLLGLLFTTILQISLTKVIGIISPIAFAVLGIISIFLILDIDIGKYLPKPKAKVYKNPLLSAFVFGFFFGAIVIPCNPLFLAALFTRAIGSTGFFINLGNFLSFGIGIAAPLLVFSIISTAASNKIIGAITKHKTIINRIAGILMLAASLYYLFFVFRILG